MPVNIVKTLADERAWKKAKKAAKGKGWKLVMHIFKNMRKKANDGK